jgi:hypothetical protein
MNREEIQNTLRENVATVTFHKVDGSQRVMRCTLKPDLLPATPVKESKQEKQLNLSVLAVYDLEAAGWRSFRIESVTNVEIN